MKFKILQDQLDELERRMRFVEETVNTKLPAYEAFIKSWEGGSKVVKDTEKEVAAKVEKKTRVKKAE